MGYLKVGRENSTALRKGPDNPEGVDVSVFEGIQQGLRADRPGFLEQSLGNFFNIDVLGERISRPAAHANWNMAIGASPIATLTCTGSWLEDFRPDLARFTIPTLVVHGDADRIVPLEVSGRRTHQTIKGSRLRVVRGGPHGLNWTHADEVNGALVEFLRA